MVLSYYNFRGSDYCNYTEAALENALHLVLSSKYECEIYEDENAHGPSLYLFHPYLNQAEGMIYRLNIYDPIPRFVIWPEDIPEALAKSLLNLGKVAMNRIITEAVRRLFESVDSDYFHVNGLYGKIQWRFGKETK